MSVKCRGGLTRGRHQAFLTHVLLKHAADARLHFLLIGFCRRIIQLFKPVTRLKRLKPVSESG